MPLGVFSSLCFTTMNISAWAFIVYSCMLVLLEPCPENKQKEVPRFLYIYINGSFGADVPQKKNYMKKLSLFLLSLFLCSVGVPILAEDVDLVPALVVQMTDGTEQVVQLDYTAVTDFSVLCNKGSLVVSVPEADLTGVRSITFAMVKQDELTNSLEEVPSLDNATTDKVFFNGKLFIRATMSDGKLVWYDVMGNLFMNYE